ncbi:MAG: hypothetical protein PHC37_03395 [Candidatus Omnitrophica bacterium]|nr:hypothetical protein [Candidatus Omnitrophota bacterium]MDD5690727.1 hypothetical protein [Candidatus Omnitrophota bacterium]
MPQIIWGGQTGCLLPSLIIFNLLFGRAIFNSTYIWLGVEAALIFIFIIKIHVFAHKIRQQLRPEGRKPYGRVVDVEGKVVEEKSKLK